ncbi:MAG TPA: cyclic nucleotide-binding domain-containing protein [Syntrophales bacterium]|nr:cyclic nucleotide-binding domain-containing protein [Syntrophales bacterium]
MSGNGAASSKQGLLENSLFKDIPRVKLEKIAESAREETVPANTVIFSQGDPGDCFYIISSGRVRVFRRDRRGVEINLSQLGRGDSFGEMALLSGESRSAHVETLEETRLIVIPKDVFLNILQDYPEISLAFMKQISTWLLEDVKIVEREVRKQYDRPRLSWFDFLLLFGISLLFAVIFNHSNPNGIPLFPKAPSREALSFIDSSRAMALYEGVGALIVDAMPASFYEQKHIAGAVNLPLALFDIVYLLTLGAEEKEKPVIVYGGTISRPYDLEVADRLMARGHRTVLVLDGGLPAWEKGGYPIGP